ncbi:MAG: thymidylate synthase [Treponema sp.]|jgi:thymidylate synthase|nr:thymidylate synthase [Treponema sp.]
MQEIFVQGRNLTEAYHKALTELETRGSILDCSDWNQRQKECAMTVHIEEPIAEPRISKLIIGGAYDLQRYVMELVDGILDFKINAGWDYTYHDRFSKYMPFVITELRRNRESRRAVISIRDNEVDSCNKDPACMQSIQYFIRDNKLDCMIFFRSNDLPEAFFFNAFGLIMLQEKVAAELGVAVGTYTHRANSMHCYEKDFQLLQNYVKAIKEKSAEDLCYNYKDDWDEMMIAEIPGIQKLVEELRNR